jgi:hypothetical protein
MAVAWKNAEAFLNGLTFYPNSVKKVEFKNEFESDDKYEQEDFQANDLYEFNGKLVPGMSAEEDDCLIDEIGRAEYDKIMSVAAKRGLKIEEKNGGFYLSKADQTELGFVSTTGFSATTPGLFEAIGKEVYDLSAEEEVTEPLVIPEKTSNSQEQIPLGEKPKSRWPWSRKHETV